MLDARRLVTRAQKCRAYQFHDSFDNYNSVSSLYENYNGTITYGSAYARFAPPAGFPGQGIKVPAGCWIKKNLSSNLAVLVIKASFYPLALPSGFTSLIGLYDGTVNANQCALGWLPSGALQVQQGWQHIGGAGAVATSPNPGIIAPLQWYGIEIEVEISNTGYGSMNVWVNGEIAWEVAAINTQFTSDVYANQVALGDSVSNGYYIDDFRVWDTTGSPPQNAPLGYDTRLICKLPSGAGALTQLTPNGASANWQCVDSNPPPGDTTYVSGATAGLEDAYAVPVAGLSAAPVMVVARACARKDDSGTRQIAAGVDSSAHAAVGPTGTVSSTYAFYDGWIQDDPNTSAAWTAAGADAAQVLVEEIA